MEINNFPVSKGRICLMSAISDILNYYNYDIDESSLLGLCEGSLFYFGGLELHDCEIDNGHILKAIKMGGIKYNINHIMDVLKKHMGLSVKGYVTDEYNKAAVKKLVKSHVDNGIPILALVMAYDMEYSVTYHKEYLSHTINIFGYDYDKDVVYITDTYVNTKPVSTYKGVLSLENLCKSFNLDRAVFEMETKERMFVIHPNERSNEKNIPQEIYRLSLKNMARNNLEGVTLGRNIYTGISGIEEFIHHFRQWFLDFTKPQLQSILRGVHSLITNYGGPYVTNDMMGQYCETLTHKEPDLIYGDLSEQFRTISRHWLILGNICYKMSLSDNVTFQEIEKRLYEICLKQEKVYKKILCSIDEKK